MAKAKPTSATPPPADTPDQPYYLQKARVKDYPPIRDAQVEFKPGLNIIIGSNGAGKTRFFRAVAEGIDLIATEHKAVTGSGFTLGGPAQITISHLSSLIKPTEGFYPAKPRVELTVDARAPVEGTDLFQAWLKQSAFDDRLKWPAYWVYFIRHHLPTPLPLLLSEEVHFRLTTRFERTAAVTGFTLSLIESIRLEAVRQEQWQETPLTEKQAEALVTETVGDYIAHLNEYLPRYSPVTEVRAGRLLRLYPDPAQQAITVDGLFMEYCVDGAWRPFKELSDGTKRLVYLISDLVAPEPGNALARVSQTQPSRIILLEEPELGIHPHQLHKLLGLIREVSEQHQVIITTHSPQVLDLLSEDELDRILICELKDPKNGTQFRRLTLEQQETARRYMTEIGFLSDYWRYSKLEEDAEAPATDPQ